MEKDWKLIYSSSDEYAVILAKQVLGENGIESVVMNKKDSFYKFGEVELYVSEEEELKASELIKEFN